MVRCTMTTLLFPGQGSQTPDMRETVERHRPDLLELALSEVGDDLFERAGDGTRWAQPAIFCAALAGWEQLRASIERRPDGGPLAGRDHRAGGRRRDLGAEDGLRLVAARGRLMQEAAEETGDGGMIAVRARGDARDRSTRWPRPPGCQWRTTTPRTSSCCPAPTAALDEAEARSRERGVRAKRLPVAGAFHSPLMEPAVEPFRARRRTRPRSARRACPFSRA